MSIALVSEGGLTTACSGRRSRSGSLDDPDREAALALAPEQAEEFDRRLAEHRADPSTAIPWEEVRKKFSDKQ